MKKIIAFLAFVFLVSTTFSQSSYQDSLSGLFVYFGPKVKINDKVLFLGPNLELAYAKNGLFGGVGFTYGEYILSLDKTYGCVCQGIDGQSPKLNLYDFITVDILLGDKIGVGVKSENMFINTKRFSLSGFITYLSINGSLSVQTGINSNFYYKETYLYLSVLYNIQTFFQK